MLHYTLPDLTPEEKKLPLAKYYEKYKLLAPPPLEQMILDSGPMNPADAISPENWLDGLMLTGYPKVSFGYCMMPDGSGYYVEYSVIPPEITPDMRQWFGHWVNFKSKSMVPEQGNLRYKLWCPVDHWDHYYVNGEDDKDGVYSMETLDLGRTGSGAKGIGAIAYNLNLRDYGLTEEREAEFKAAGYRIGALYEEFEGPGHHLLLRMSRPCPFGGTENLKYEWIGYYAKDGKIIRDTETPVDEAYVKNVLTHNTVEHMHQHRFLPELYAEYHNKPIDAD